MPRANPNAKGDAIFQSFRRPYAKRLSQEEHVQRCLTKAAEVNWNGEKPYPKSWTAGDAVAWEMEQYRYEAWLALKTQVRRGNMLAMTHYHRLLGTPETRPGAGVQVNINKHTNNNSFRFVVEEVTAGGVQRLLDQHTNTQVVEGEAREVEEEEGGGEGTGEGETREEEDTRVVEVGVEGWQQE